MPKVARSWTVAVYVAAALLATSCTRLVTDARVVAAPDMGKAGATAQDCTSVDAPMTKIPDHTDEEPLLRIPQPQGWERLTMMDSQLIRFGQQDFWPGNEDRHHAGLGGCAVDGGIKLRNLDRHILVLARAARGCDRDRDFDSLVFGHQ